MEKHLRDKKDKQVEEICNQVFGRLPKLYWRFSSFSHKNFYVEFEDESKYVIKIYEPANLVSECQKNEELTKKLFNTPYFKKLIYLSSNDYIVFKYVKGECIRSEEARDPKNLVLYMKRITEFHQTSTSQDPKDHFLYTVWSNKDQIYNRIRELHNKHSKWDKIQSVLKRIELFVDTVFPLYVKELELVLNHGDLYSSNILWDKQNKRYVLIDYDDIGLASFMLDLNYFSKLLALRYDDSLEKGYCIEKEFYPSEEKIKEMIKYYLFFSRYGSKYNDQPDLIESIETIKTDKNMKEITDKEINKYYRLWHVDGAAIALKWILWGFAEIKKEGIVLDDVEHSLSWYEWFEESMTVLGYPIK